MESRKEGLGFWDKLFSNEIEYSRFGVISTALVLVGCLGGMAVGLGAINSTIQLIFVVFPTMAALASCLAVMPMKWILNLSITAIIIDLIIITINFVT